MFQKKPKHIKIANVNFAPEMTFYSLNSLGELQNLVNSNHPLFETDNDYFVVDGFQVFRVLKPETLPRILKVQKLELNPDFYGAKIELTKEELFQFAKTEQLFVFETEDSYIIPSTTVMFAKKKEPKT